MNNDIKVTLKPETRQVDWAELRQRVLDNALAQKKPENRENYFKSCVRHGGELAIIAALVKTEIN